MCFRLFYFQSGAGGGGINRHFDVCNLGNSFFRGRDTKIVKEKNKNQERNTLECKKKRFYITMFDFVRTMFRLFYFKSGAGGGVKPTF